MCMKLKIAIQRSGRLYEDSVKLLKECGIDISNGGSRLKASAGNFPLEVFFLRDDDIPQYVEDGVADAGIVGENVCLEKARSVEIIERLGFGRCRLSVAVDKNAEYGPGFLEGKKIATSYPRLLGEFLQARKISAEIHEISGSVEIAPGIGLADAVCDLVSTGSTLLTNGLKEAEVVLRSEAVLIRNRQSIAEVNEIMSRLLFRMRAVKKAKNNKYILLNAPKDRLDEIVRLVPGMKSPTVMPLADPAWCSLHSVVDENDFWNIIEQLKAAGAEGILVVPIEKMII